MKITAIKTFPVFVDSRNYLFVKVETDEGLYGVGEFGITWKEQAGVRAIEHMTHHLLGEDPFNTEWLWQKLFRGDFFPGGRINMAAQSAIDIALWDIKGKALDQPVHMLLGGRMRDKVVCYTGIGGATPADSASSAVTCVEEGWKYLRFSVNDRDGVLEPRTAVRDAIDHFAAIREAVGPDIEICIDVHTRLDPPDSIRLGRELEQYDPFFIEDPLRCENPQSYRNVRHHVSVPLAVGEHYATKWEFRQMIEEELMDYARIDLCNRRADGSAQSRELVRDPLHQDRAAQPARSRISGRLPASRSRHGQCRSTGRWTRGPRFSRGPVSGSGAVLRRLPAPSRQARTRG